MSTCQFLVALSLLAGGISAFITRLPACGRYHANFTERHEGKYFRGRISDTIQNVTRKECSLHCIFRDGCLFINQRYDGTFCELVTSHIGTFEVNPAFQVVSTDYTRFDWRGPLCKYLKPACTFNHQTCVDICEPPGFNCLQFANVALRKTVKVSSKLNDNRRGEKSVDGTNNAFWTAAKSTSPWIVVDLAEAYKIPAVTLVNNPQEKFRSLMKFVTVRIGNYDHNKKYKNPVCKDNVDQSKILVKRYVCKNGLMVGRYVVVSRSGQNGVFTVAEIIVFSV